MVTLRWKDKVETLGSRRFISSWHEGIISLVVVACCGFGAGLCYRSGASFIFLVVATVIAILAAAALHFRQVSATFFVVSGPSMFLTIYNISLIN